ncbi:MAG: hypothetical protein KAS12_01445 [Candidatus Aenigmarchaeota archaeon]|nr:hypothetical protein [Candidatus Aenigmarchaeota archaeon]
MTWLISFLIVIIIIIIIYLSYWRQYLILEKDHEKYVVDTHDDYKSAAQTLRELNEFNIDLMRHLKKKYLSDVEHMSEYGNKALITERILRNYRPDTISEMNPHNLFGYTSYAENKGEKLVFCIREKNKEKKIHDLDLLKFVSIHEMSHLGTREYGHPEKFWIIFKWLLIEAESVNLYKNIDFEKNPPVYCGMTITYNPRFDKKIKLL